MFLSVPNKAYVGLTYKWSINIKECKYYNDKTFPGNPYIYIFVKLTI